jgi:hypothetical protein
MKTLFANLALALALTLPAGMALAQEMRPTVDRPGHREFNWVGDRLGVSGSMQVTVRRDGAPRVVVTGPADLVERVILRDGSLGMESSYSSWWRNWGPNDRIQVAITGATLNDVSVSGSGSVRLGTLRQSDLEVHISGSGSVYADGQINRLDAHVSGSGNARLDGMRAQDGRFSVSGSGGIVVTAVERVDVSVSGSGNVRISDRPRDFSHSVSGSGRIVAGGQSYTRRTRELEREREREMARMERDRERDMARAEREREREREREERQRERDRERERRDR